MFIRIQTNRVKLVQVISDFKKNAIETELLIAPRPLPKERFKYYIGFANVISDSKNHKLLESIKNHKYINNDEFNKEIDSIKYYWSAKAKE